MALLDQTKFYYFQSKKERNDLPPIDLSGRMSGAYTDELGSLPGHYWANEDLPAFMERASPFIMRYCRNRLTRDDDLIGDFYVHFYEERAAGCLARYKSRQHIPFTGFFATYLRHEFLNYTRSVRDARYTETAVDDLHEWGTAANDTAAENGDQSEQAYAALAAAVEKLPADLRLALKLYHGMELFMAELQQIAGLCETPRAAAELVREFRERLRQRRTRLRKVEDRSAYLNYLIHRRAEDAPAVQRWSRWKQRLRDALAHDRGVMSTSEIGALFQVAKSTVARRLAQARKLLEQDQSNPEEQV